MIVKLFILTLSASVNAVNNATPVIIIGSTGQKVSLYKDGGGV